MNARFTPGSQTTLSGPESTLESLANQQDEYVFGGWASVLWLLCLPPIFAYIGFFWIVGTHDKLVGATKEKRIKKWLAEHEDLNK